MKLHPIVFAASLLLTAGAGFGVGLFVQSRFALIAQNQKPESGAPAKPDSAWDDKKAMQKKVLIDYLDGKELRTEGKPIDGAGGKPLVFRMGGVEAVQFGDTASKSGNTPWATTVTVLATVESRKYAVHARLEYREVENAIVIVSFTPTEVSPQ